ncbi:MAG: glycosyltransferase family 4 protein, partial [Chitinispirillia bacterium]
NIPFLIQSFKKFTDKYPKARIQMLIVGNGTEKNRLEKISNEIGIQDKISFVGETEYPEKYYHQMDVYINPNTNKEGMNNCILEAMACGLPVITSDLPANRAWLNENENVLFFNTDKSDELETKLHILYNNETLRETISKNNVFRIKNEFTVDLFIQRNMKLYLHLLKR